MAAPTNSGKWVATAASIWIQCAAGSSYAFSIYSPILKSSQSYDQSTLDTVSVFKDIGANAGVLSGLLFAAVAPGPRRRVSAVGPWLVHLAGAIQCFVGYIFLWAAVTELIPSQPVPLTCFFMFLAAHAQTFFNTASVVTGVLNFPDYGGTIVGIMKGFLGLSGPVLIQVYQTLFNGKPSSFLLMLAFLPTFISLSLMFLVRLYPLDTRDDNRHLNGFSVIAVVLAAFLMITIIVKNIFPLPRWAHIVTLVLLFLVLASPIIIVVKSHREDSARQSKTLALVKRPLLGDSKLAEADKFSAKGESKEHHKRHDDVASESGSSSDKTQQDLEDANILQAMRSLNFWLIFVAMACGMGSGLATINNMSQIGESLSYTTLEINNLVSLWGIWNFLGRFGAGYVSDIFLHRRGWPRPLMMAITLATMSVGHAVIASGFPGNLYFGSIILGICYGSQWSLMPTITSEIFGVRHMGTIFNTIAIASPVGSYILSVKLVGYVYDEEVVADEVTCFGAHCFMLSFSILAFVCLFGSLAALLLFFRTRTYYRLVVLRRLQHFEKL